MTSIQALTLENASFLHINRSEALRYMGAQESDSTFTEMIVQCEEEAKAYAVPRAAYLKAPVDVVGDKIDFGFMKVESKNLAKNLAGCSEAYVFAATLGLGVERQFRKIAAISQSKAMVFSAVCSALIESFCDYINGELVSAEKSRPRFSCGYGDFSLKHQREILDALEAGKRLGICLTDSYMMVPVKSVTAIIGIRR